MLRVDLNAADRVHDLVLGLAVHGETLRAVSVEREGRAPELLFPTM